MEKLDLTFQLHTEDMNIEYTGCMDRPGICSNILTSCSLQRSHAVLSPGQSYNIGNKNFIYFLKHISLHFPKILE